MTLAVDTSALLSIFKAEREAEAWVELLIRLSAHAALVAMDVVWAETATLFPNLEILQSNMSKLGIRYDPIHEKAAFHAGQSFLFYRRAGGPRQHLIPDFLVAAHALHQTDGLIAADRGYIRKYFRQLRLHAI